MVVKVNNIGCVDNLIIAGKLPSFLVNPVNLINLVNLWTPSKRFYDNRLPRFMHISPIFPAELLNLDKSW